MKTITAPMQQVGSPEWGIPADFASKFARTQTGLPIGECCSRTTPRPYAGFGPYRKATAFRRAKTWLAANPDRVVMWACAVAVVAALIRLAVESPESPPVALDLNDAQAAALLAAGTHK